MRFGHFCLATYFPDVDGDVGTFTRRWMDLLCESEALGFDSLWANEHHFGAYGGILPSTATMLAGLSQRTTRVRLGTSVVVLPLHNPIEVAEQLAMVDLMSNGRVEFGAGRGGGPYDYIRMAMPHDDLQARLQEQIEIIRKAWSGEILAHEGRFYKFSEVIVWPRPQQRPHPPIWLSCTQTPASFEWAGRMGFNLQTVPFFGIQGLVSNNKLYRESWAGAGHPARKWRTSAYYNCVLSESKTEARETARGAWRRYTAMFKDALSRNDRAQAHNPYIEKMLQDLLDVDRMVEEMRYIACTPDEAVSVLERAQDAMGFTDCICTFYFGGISYEQAQSSMRLFAREVMPALREREPKLAR